MIGQVEFSNPQNQEDWRRFLTKLSCKDSYGIFLMVGEDTIFNFEEVQPVFREVGIPVFGGVFPGVICGDSWYKEGVVGCSIDRPLCLEVVNDINSFEVPENKIEINSDGTVLVVVDGLCCNISSFLDKLFENCSGPLRFIGGGAGRLKPGQKSVLFTKDKFFYNGALLAKINGLMGVGVTHGWEPMYGPLVANRTEGNTLVELNWQQAFPHYQQILKEKARIYVTPQNFTGVARDYPFGMVKMEDSIIVRDPIRLDDNGSIVLVGEIPENSIIMILKGNPKRLIASSAQAVKQALNQFKHRTDSAGRGALVIDCISRCHYLGVNFNRELITLRKSIQSDLYMFGFLSLGEIGSNGDRYLEFYNKTTVVGVG